MAPKIKKNFVSPNIADNHHSALIAKICHELNISEESLIDFELCLADTQPAVRMFRFFSKDNSK